MSEESKGALPEGGASLVVTDFQTLVAAVAAELLRRIDEKQTCKRCGATRAEHGPNAECPSCGRCGQGFNRHEAGRCPAVEREGGPMWI